MLMNNIQIYKWMNFAWFYLFIYLSNMFSMHNICMKNFEIYK
jgi:hypothetical protein